AGSCHSAHVIRRFDGQEVGARGDVRPTVTIGKSSHGTQQGRSLIEVNLADGPINIAGVCIYFDRGRCCENRTAAWVDDTDDRQLIRDWINRNRDVIGRTEQAVVRAESEHIHACLGKTGRCTGRIRICKRPRSGTAKLAPLKRERTWWIGQRIVGGRAGKTGAARQSDSLVWTRIDHWRLVDWRRAGSVFEANGHKRMIDWRPKSPKCIVA